MQVREVRYTEVTIVTFPQRGWMECVYGLNIDAGTGSDKLEKN